MKQYKLLLIILFALSAKINAQNILINTGGTVNVNGGETFTDAGGASGNYGNSDNHTITLCPTNAGEAVMLDFTFFRTGFQDDIFGTPDEDALFIYDGNSTATQNIGKLMGDYTDRYSTATNPYRVGVRAPFFSGSPVYASTILDNVYTPTIFSATNSSGCLTLQFINTSGTNYEGWIANVSTFQTVVTPDCEISIGASADTICTAGDNVTLTANGLLFSTPINNNFNDGTLGAGWVGTPSASVVSTVCSSPTLDGTDHLWMQNATAPRILESTPFDVSNGGVISFEYRQASDNGTASPCESPDRNSTYSTLEGVYLQYSTDNGTSWNTFKYIFPNGQTGPFGAEYGLNGCGDYVKGWTKMQYPIPVAAQTANTKFRWIQAVATSETTDNWGLDNIFIATPQTTTLTISDLTTGTVISTTSTNSTSVVVNPTVQTTYRATISDGTNSCSENITIYVGCINCDASTTLIWD